MTRNGLVGRSQPRPGAGRSCTCAHASCLLVELACVASSLCLFRILWIAGQWVVLLLPVTCTSRRPWCVSSPTRHSESGLCCMWPLTLYPSLSGSYGRCCGEHSPSQCLRGRLLGFPTSAIADGQLNRQLTKPATSFIPPAVCKTLLAHFLTKTGFLDFEILPTECLSLCFWLAFSYLLMK